MSVNGPMPGTSLVDDLVDLVRSKASFKNVGKLVQEVVLGKGLGVGE